MAFRFSTHLKQLPPWYNIRGLEFGVVLGTMGRLVRNLKGEAFPGWSTKESRARVAETLTPVVRSMAGFKQAAHAAMPELDKVERKLLLERKQITPCLAARQDGSHVFINKKQDTIIMLNEEEHLAIHRFASGNQLDAIVADLRKKAKHVESQADVAYSKEYGYLTSMASECGDGLQLYMVLHLPGHVMLNQIDKVERALNKMHLNISPFYTEYGEETGHLYVLFSPPAPMGTTDDILKHMEATADSLTEKELMLRQKVAAEDTITLSDAIGRMYGALRHGSIMRYPELLHTVSMIRIATETGFLLFHGEAEQLQARLADIMLISAPTHLSYTSEETSETIQAFMRMHLMKNLSSHMHVNEELSLHLLS